VNAFLFVRDIFFSNTKRNIKMPGSFATNLQLLTNSNHPLYLCVANAVLPKFVLNRTINVARDQTKLAITGSTGLGHQTSTPVGRGGDVLTGITLVVNLPGLSKGHYKDRTGFHLIQNIEFLADQQVLQRFEGEFLQMWDAVSKSPGKRCDEMVGNFLSEEQRDLNSRQAHALYVELPFFFSEPGKGLPLHRLQQDLTIKIALNDLSSVMTDLSATILQPIDAIGKSRSGVQPVARAPTNVDASVHLEVEYLHLENQLLELPTGLWPITQVQGTTLSYTKDANRVQLNLPFKHMVRELLWSVHTTVPDDLLLLPDPVCNAQLFLNTHARFRMAGENEPVEGRWFRTRGMKNHSNVPANPTDGFYYAYSFDDHPESFQPGGALNFSKIQNKIFEFEMDKTYHNGTIKLYARNWNFVQFKNGKIATKYLL
jgi:hypothetical protein